MKNTNQRDSVDEWNAAVRSKNSCDDVRFVSSGLCLFIYCLRLKICHKDKFICIEIMFSACTIICCINVFIGTRNKFIACKNEFIGFLNRFIFMQE